MPLQCLTSLKSISLTFISSKIVTCLIKKHYLYNGFTRINQYLTCYRVCNKTVQTILGSCNHNILHHIVVTCSYSSSATALDCGSMCVPYAAQSAILISSAILYVQQSTNYNTQCTQILLLCLLRLVIHCINGLDC